MIVSSAMTDLMNASRRIYGDTGKLSVSDLTKLLSNRYTSELIDIFNYSDFQKWNIPANLKVTLNENDGSATMGYTLDRTTNPWTIWFDNGCRLQFPDYGTSASVYGYGFYANEQNTNLDPYPLTGVVMSASHGTLTLDTISKKK